MGSTDEQTFTELINAIAPSIKRINEMLENKMVSFKRLSWDEENRRQVLININNDIELQKRISEDIKKQNEAIRAGGEVEKRNLVSEGLKFISEAQSILKNTKEFATEVEKRKYLELSTRINLANTTASEIFPEHEEEVPVLEAEEQTAEPVIAKKPGRPKKDKAAA